MRFIELSFALIAAVAVANAAPTMNNGIVAIDSPSNMVFDPKHASHLTGRREQHQKRHKGCCGGEVIDIDPVVAVDPVPAVAEKPTSNVQGNRVGDVVNVEVNANHG